jgi:hypothetical protein
LLGIPGVFPLRYLQILLRYKWDFAVFAKTGLAFCRFCQTEIPFYQGEKATFFSHQQPGLYKGGNISIWELIII